MSFYEEEATTQEHLITGSWNPSLTNKTAATNATLTLASLQSIYPSMICREATETTLAGNAAPIPDDCDEMDAAGKWDRFKKLNPFHKRGKDTGNNTKGKGTATKEGIGGPQGFSHLAHMGPGQQFGLEGDQLSRRSSTRSSNHSSSSHHSQSASQLDVTGSGSPNWNRPLPSVPVQKNHERWNKHQPLEVGKNYASDLDDLDSNRQKVTVEDHLRDTGKDQLIDSSTKEPVFVRLEELKREQPVYENLPAQPAYKPPSAFLLQQRQPGTKPRDPLPEPRPPQQQQGIGQSAPSAQQAQAASHSRWQPQQRIAQSVPSAQQAQAASHSRWANKDGNWV